MKSRFFLWLKQHLKNNPNSILILCDLGYPEALDLQTLYPDRVLNVGVAEQNAALVAKGLCSEGFEVFIYGISSFTLWRSAEVFKLFFGAEDRVRVIGNGGGFGYGIMGSTHHSLDDLGLVSLWPAWTSWIPARDEEMPEVLDQISKVRGPHYLRLTNNSQTSTEIFQDLKKVGQGTAVTVVTFGPLLDQVRTALQPTSDVQIFSVGKWPLDIQPIQEHFSHSKKIIFFEEHQEQGGLSQKIAAGLEGPRGNIQIHAAQRTHLNGSRNSILDSQGFDALNIAHLVLAMKNRSDDKKS